MTASAPAAAASGEVRVWTVRTGTSPAGPLSESVLSAAERVRAARFRFDSDRYRFVACRAALREILGAELGALPSQVELAYGPNGKPTLADKSAGIEFNVSHREDVGLIAVAKGRRLGIDVERVRPIEDSEKLSARFFSPREAATLRAVPAAGRDEAFFSCWTRKEAFVKALGAGLSLPLDSFCVSLAPGEPPALLEWQGRDAERAGWNLDSWSPAPGYVAAIVVEGEGWRLRRMSWPGSTESGCYSPSPA